MDKTMMACMNCAAVNRVPYERMDQHPKCGSCQTELPVHGSLIEQNGKALQALIQAADKPVVVDFWAPWCGPCLSFAPTFASAAQQHGKDFIFVKFDTEKDSLGSQAYQIRSIPTLAMFVNGQEKQRVSGALPMPQLKQWLMQARS